MPTESDLNAIRKVHHPVHSFTQRLFYLPRRRPFSTPPWKIVFGKVWCKMMWPNHLSFYHLTIASGECGRPTTLVITLRTKSFFQLLVGVREIVILLQVSLSFKLYETTSMQREVMQSQEPRKPAVKHQAAWHVHCSLIEKKGVKIVKTYSS